ncbi:MAG TPA: hypothetical protein DDZ80_07950 [Cyanobacteria bacterium UBA8803]|nr:hypothetical protein [Cyanobacteria bacterium UBA8803]
MGYVPALPELLTIVCFNNCSDRTPLHIPPTGNQLLNYNRSISELLSVSTIDKRQLSLLIEKSRYRLTLYYGQQPLKSYPVVFGSNPVDDKLKEGDKRTPEGLFKIQDLYPHPTWSKFLWLDYPTRESWQKHFQAKIAGKIHWRDRIGGEIGIHGVPKGADSLINEQSNWTWGCISLKNKDVDELYRVVQQGTEVEILP